MKCSQNSNCSSCFSIVTWDDWALNAKSSAVFGELDELLNIVEQLRDDDLGPSLYLNTISAA